MVALLKQGRLEAYTNNTHETLQCLLKHMTGLPTVEHQTLSSGVGAVVHVPAQLVLTAQHSAPTVPGIADQLPALADILSCSVE
jgi:hypothetical protein